MWDNLKKIKKWVVEKVLWAEKELKGKTGKEKRAVVVAKLNEIINLPWVPEWVEGKLIGFFVDMVCDKANILTDHDLTKVESEEQKNALVEVIEAPMQMVVSAASKAQTVDERLAELCKMYGIETEEPPKPEAPAPEAKQETAAEAAPEAKIEPPSESPKTEEPAPVPALKPGYLTPHFKRSEFACKCGCGKDGIDPALVADCETIRAAAGVALHVNSGLRCEKNNAKAGGVKGSYHLYGKAADLSCSLGARKLYEIIQALYAAGRLPSLKYCIWYKKKNFVHIDCGKDRSVVFAIK